MNRQEYERLKEAEKAHLKKVRAMKEQLREANRTKNLADAINKLDTSELDDEFESALRAVQEKNITAEARFEMAMDALDDAATREQQRLETEQFEKQQREAAASDLVAQLKAESDVDQNASQSSQAGHGASALPADPDDARAAPADSDPPAKTIGRNRPSSD